jgi:hypothetical protein
MFASGQVYKGRWNKTDVALKVLRLDGDITPSAEVGPEHTQTPNLH